MAVPQMFLSLTALRAGGQISLHHPTSLTEVCLSRLQRTLAGAGQEEGLCGAMWQRRLASPSADLAPG